MPDANVFERLQQLPSTDVMSVGTILQNTGINRTLGTNDFCLLLCFRMIRDKISRHLTLQHSIKPSSSPIPLKDNKTSTEVIEHEHVGDTSPSASSISAGSSPSWKSCQTHETKTEASSTLAMDLSSEQGECRPSMLNVSSMMESPFYQTATSSASPSPNYESSPVKKMKQTEDLVFNCQFCPASFKLHLALRTHYAQQHPTSVWGMAAVGQNVGQFHASLDTPTTVQ